MINVRTIRKLKENDGFTLKNGKKVAYKTGYQVAYDKGYQTTIPTVAAKMTKEFKGNCGVWYSDGIYYIDESKRISTKRDAITMGKNENQQSILKWSNMSLIWL